MGEQIGARKWPRPLAEAAFEFYSMARPADSPRKLLCRRQRLHKQTYSFEFIFIRQNGFLDSALKVIGDPKGHEHGALKFSTDLRRRHHVWDSGDVERCYSLQLNSWVVVHQPVKLRIWPWHGQGER